LRVSDLSGSQTLEVDAPLDRCFAVVADLDDAALWHPTLTAVTVRERDAEGRPTLLSTKLDAQVTKLDSVLRFSYEDPSTVRWTQESGDLQGMTGAWSLAPLDDGRTSATYTLEVDFNRMLKMAVRGPMVDWLSTLLISKPPQKLKAHLEQG